MARPRKDADEPLVEQRIEDAFWELVQKKPLEHISVGSIAELARCNRGTFYYHYKDIYDLLDRVIEQNMLEGMASGIFGSLLGNDAIEEFSESIRDQQRSIDRICLLLHSESAPLVMRKIKEVAFKTWMDALGCTEENTPLDLRLLFEFAISGLLGILAYRASSGMTVSIEDIIDALAPEIPSALVCRLRRELA